MRIGVSGHRNLAPPTAALVDAALRATLADLVAAGAATGNPGGPGGPGDLVGVTCIADGADTLFADAVLDLGARIEVVVPAERHRDGLPGDHHGDYDRLLAAAARVHRLPFVDSTPEAHMAASERMLDLADHLVAVWDGHPARGYGGTADVVTAAHARNLPTTILWPRGATRR